MFGLTTLATRIVLAGSLLGLIVASVLWYGHTRYAAGQRNERAEWERKIAATNAATERANAEATTAREKRREGEAVILGGLGGVIAGPSCDLPPTLRDSLNRIGAP